MAGVVILGACVAACASPQPKQKKHRPKEYFAESEYGVKASPRVVATAVSKMPRGGGRDQVGKPYQVKGKWYYPKEEPGYTRVGKASWYGSAFHGRLTANGEVYDMAHLSAAHPTMPLPSYARVTNLANGNSVIVRVNDRGPYARDRVVDLSQRAAELLDYQHHGTANVKVEYVGRAPLEGRDDEFLLASFRSGSDPIGQPASGVMIAMAGPTPTAPMPDARPAMNQIMTDGAAPIPAMQPEGVLQPPSMPGAVGIGDPILPAIGPIVTEKPAILFGIARAKGLGGNSALAGYADERVAAASETQSLAYASVLTPAAISDAWKKLGVDKAASAENAEYIDAGFFSDKNEADRIAAMLGSYGKVRRVSVPTETGELYGITLAGSSDALLQAAWATGATDAFVVRPE